MATKHLTIKDTAKWDVNDSKFLKSQGFNTHIYYCGNHKHEKIWTNIRNKLSKKGIRFPNNPACFIHDVDYGIIYSSKGSLFQKLKQKTIVDYRFLIRMLLILKSLFVKKRISSFEYRSLLSRALLFYIIVTLMTPIYWFQAKKYRERK